MLIEKLSRIWQVIKFDFIDVTEIGVFEQAIFLIAIGQLLTIQILSLFEYSLTEINCNHTDNISLSLSFHMSIFVMPLRFRMTLWGFIYDEIMISLSYLC